MATMKKVDTLGKRKKSLDGAKPFASSYVSA